MVTECSLFEWYGKGRYYLLGALAQLECSIFAATSSQFCHPQERAGKLLPITKIEYWNSSSNTTD